MLKECLEDNCIMLGKVDNYNAVRSRLNVIHTWSYVNCSGGSGDRHEKTMNVRYCIVLVLLKERREHSTNAARVLRVGDECRLAKCRSKTG